MVRKPEDENRVTEGSGNVFADVSVAEPRERKPEGQLILSLALPSGV
jgi:hypothetical protein